MSSKPCQFLQLILCCCALSNAFAESAASAPSSLGIQQVRLPRMPNWSDILHLGQIIPASTSSDHKNLKWRMNQALAQSKSHAKLTKDDDDHHHPIRRAFYFWTRAGPIVAHYKYTQWRLRHASREERDRVYDRLHNTYCHPTLQICLHLKGLFIKIGQVLSARPDFVPHAYVELLSTVQDSVPQLPYEYVRELVCNALRNNQGLEWEDVFLEMDETALGSASIGQCHRAVLKANAYQTNSTGGITTYTNTNSDYSSLPVKHQEERVVAVKVMHPNAQIRFQSDFQLFAWLCRIALPGWKPILDELRNQMMTEFNYRQEARNLEEVRTNMKQSPYRNQITIPEPIHELCSHNVLVMELLDGKKFGDAMEDRLALAIGSQDVAKDFLRQKRLELVLGKTVDASDSNDDLDVYTSNNSMISFATNLLQRQGPTSFWTQWITACRLFVLHRHVQRCVTLLIDVHGYQIFQDRVFNGDCHPGNMLELTNGKIGLIDYGQTKRLSLDESLTIAKVVALLGQDSINTTQVAMAMRECGFRTKWDRDDVLTQYAKLFFDSDEEAKLQGCATPQLYLMKLSLLDPLLHVPDAAIFTARASYLFRGMGSIVVGDPIRTCKYWKKHADQALRMAEDRQVFYS